MWAGASDQAYVNCRGRRTFGTSVIHLYGQGRPHAGYVRQRWFNTLGETLDAVAKANKLSIKQGLPLRLETHRWALQALAQSFNSWRAAYLVQGQCGSPCRGYSLFGAHHSSRTCVTKSHISAPLTPDRVRTNIWAVSVCTRMHMRHSGRCNRISKCPGLDVASYLASLQACSSKLALMYVHGGVRT